VKKIRFERPFEDKLKMSKTKDYVEKVLKSEDPIETLLHLG
jgi:hypothetical protein